ncbi:cytochrome c oxidase assembly factor CtaG [Paenibacillus thiaminolyticus]|uniref:cytochrome c oxidase assembly factor CtaG n=1 Tax=Paenibacillus thiaminolyticus TaxID=49283 RepID=UPI00232F77C5|nr:cytochrome c oxidase assembly factor CtaG [Paenibacillus thiaminolyticus]WCF08790.1 cytochrome c oxidase assembly factor CtaG [Paenibacillus thiaminolyticus]
MLELTKYFSPYDVWSPLFLVSSVLIIILYLGITGPYRRVFAQVDPVPVPKKLMFISGVLLLYLAQGGPLNIMSHMMLTFHMLMMAITYIIVPPLILLGVPAWLWKYLLDRKPLRRLKGFMHPILMAVMFNALFSFYHVPAIHDYVMTHYAVHVVYYIVLFIASMIMWWPIVVPVPEWVILSDVKKMGYIFLNGMLITPACALIIFASEPLYATYVDKETWIQAMGYCLTGDPSKLLAAFDGPEFFNWFSPEEDQQLGGVIMKLVQEIMFGCILYYVFIHWYRRESKEDDDIVDTLPDGQLHS